MKDLQEFLMLAVGGLLIGISQVRTHHLWEAIALGMGIILIAAPWSKR